MSFVGISVRVVKFCNTSIKITTALRKLLLIFRKLGENCLTITVAEKMLNAPIAYVNWVTLREQKLSKKS